MNPGERFRVLHGRKVVASPSGTSSLMPAPTTRKYRAFISYSHAADDRLAPALQSGLHHFAKPWYRLRAMRVFRDKTGLAVTPALWSSIQEALGDADYFILLASPQAAQSAWVQKEVDWWLRNRLPSHLLIVWTDGELAWDRAAADFDWSRTTALPRLLEKAFGEEPNFLDLRFARRSTDLTLRHPKFLEAIASLSATLQNRSLDELVGEDVSQHHKTVRLLRAAAVGSLLLTVAAGFAIYISQQARSTATQVAGDIADAAKRLQREALSRQVTERSLAALGSNPDLAMLLAVHAACAHPGDGAISALRRSLASRLAPRRTVQAHTGGALHAGFAPDGRRLISGGDDNSARVWETNSGELLLDLQGHDGGVTGADFTADSTRIVTSSRHDETARVWDAVSGQILTVIRQEGLTNAWFRPGGKEVLTTASEAVLWDARSGDRLRTLASRYGQLKGASSLEAIGFSPDGKRVALVDWHPSVSDADSGTVLFELEGHTAQVLDIAYSADGERLLTAAADHTARVWQASSGRSIAVLPHGATVRHAMFASNGRWIVTAAIDKVVRVWDAASKTKLADIDAGTEDLAGFGLSPDGRFVITSTEEPSVRVFETGTGSQLVELTGHTGPVFTTRFSPDGNLIVTAGLDGELRLYQFDLGGSAEQLLALARQRVSRPLTEEERAQHLPAGFTAQAPDCG